MNRDMNPKMSKRGIFIDPLPLIERLGADVFRFWSAGEVTHGYDFRCNEVKIESAKKFLSKLWNISRFISSFPVIDEADLEPTDKWIMSELDNLVSKCKKGYDGYNFFIPAVAIREFMWNLFAAHYMEMVKSRAYGDGVSAEQKNSAIFTLHKVLSTVLKLLAPITPFISDKIWTILYSSSSIHAERQVESTGAKYEQSTRTTITDFTATVWAKKKDAGLSLKDEIRIKVPDSLADFKTDLVSMHNIVE